MTLVTLSSQNQITLPVSLGLVPREKFFVDKEEDKIVLTRIKKTIVDQTAGSLSKYIPASKRGVSWSKIMEVTRKLAAKEIAEEA